MNEKTCKNTAKPMHVTELVTNQKGITSTKKTVKFQNYKKMLQVNSILRKRKIPHQWQE